jgi:hypothetical protein
MVSQKVVTPLKNGVQLSCNSLKILDSGSEAGMTKKADFRLFTSSLRLNKFPVLQYEHPLSIGCHFSIMRDHYDRRAALMKPLKKSEDFQTRF